MTAAETLAAEIADLRRRLAALETSSQLGLSSVPDGSGGDVDVVSGLRAAVQALSVATDVDARTASALDDAADALLEAAAASNAADDANAAAAQAATDAASAQTAASNAQTAAADATTKATNAQTAADAATTAANNIGPTQITDDAIQTRHITAGAVTAAEIAANTITAAQIAAHTLTAAQIAAATITAAELAAGSVEAGKIAAGAVSTDSLAAVAVTAAKIAAGAIQTGHLAADSVAAGKVAADVITAREIAAGTITASEIAARAITADLLASVLTISSRFVAGDPNGARTELNSNGIEVWTGKADTDTPAIALNGSGTDTLKLTDADGNAVASLGSDGSLSANGGSISGDLSVGGYPIVGDSFPDHQGYAGGYGRSLLDMTAGGIIGLDWIGSSYTVSTERAISQLTVKMRPNRTYKIRVMGHTQLPSGSTAAGLFAVAIRTDGVNGGSAPTTSSSRMNLHVAYLPAYGSNYGPTIVYEDVFRTGDTDNGDQTFLLTAQTLAGTIGASAPVTFGGASGRLGHFIIEDLGPYVEETGLAPASTSGGSTSTKKTYTSTWSATWGQTYKQDNSQNTYQSPSTLLQGYYSGTNGNQASMIGFTGGATSGETGKSILTALSGATIQSCKVFLYATDWYASGTGGTARIGTHSSTATSAPSTFSGNQNRIASSSFPNPGGRWVDLGKAIGAEFASGTTRGIVLGHTPTNSQTDYGHFAGVGTSHPPLIQISYTK